MLTLAHGLKVPAAIFGQHLVVLGKTRAGKSSVLRLFVESLLDRNQRVCVIDPKGDWHGLRASADGAKAGYPVVIFGGNHADLPLSEHAGKSVAELVATGNRPCVIDLGGWMVGQRTRFFIDFASTLFRSIDAPLHLIIDEVHNFAPQGKILDPDAGKMLHWANRLGSEGAGKGLVIFSASQRPQKVHKDFLTCAETLVAMRVIHKLDRDAVKDWIDGAGDPAKGREVLNTLASMARGEGWVWSPEAQYGPQRVQFPLFKTYDSFAAPTAGRTKTPLKGWADVDLDDIKSRMAATFEEAKANDPAELKRQIADLKRQLAAKRLTNDPHALKAAHMAGAAERGRHWTKTVEAQKKWATSLVKRLGQIGELARLNGDAPEISPPSAIAPPKPIPVLPSTFGSMRTICPRPRTVPQASSEAVGVSKAAQRVLDAIAWWGSVDAPQPSRAQVAFMAGYTVNGHFNNLCGQLRSISLIDYPVGDHLCLTEDGAATANLPENPPSLATLQARIRHKLSGAQLRLFDVLLDARANKEDPLDCETLASRAGYTVNGHFNNLRGQLHTLGLVDYCPGGRNRASDLVFPEELS